MNIENDDFNNENENMSRKARGSVNSSQILDRNGKSDQEIQKVRNKRNNKIKLKDDCIDSFLNKALNIEYVFLILTGITQVMEAQINKFENVNDHS